MGNRKKDIIVFLLILLINSAFMLVRWVSDLDELWNYNFARNIFDGLLPYRDFNIIITPLYPAIVAIFLNIANEVIVARILAILLFTGTMFLGYKLLDGLVKNKWVPILGTLILLFIYKDMFWGDYNFAFLFIVMLVMYQELRNNKGKVLILNIKYDLLVGVLTGLAILTKQTTGLFLAFTFVVYKWLFVRNKQDAILAFKISLARGIGVLIPIIGFVIYLLVTGIMGDFVDYSILGIATFNNSFPYSELLTHPGIGLTFKMIGVLVPVFFIFNTYMLWKSKDTNLAVLLIFSLQNMIIVYPLCDVVHFLVGALPILVTTVYSAYLICEKDLTEMANKAIAIVTIASIIIFALYAVVTLVNYAKNAENDLKHFWGVPMSAGLHDAMVLLDTFIDEREQEGKEVYIVNLDAVLPMIVADKYNKHYDMLTKGNMGSKGEDGIIEDIEQKENAVFLISPKPSNNRQSSEKIRSFIQDNYTNVGQVLDYSIYEK